MFLGKLQFFFSHLLFRQIHVMFSTQTNVFHTRNLAVIWTKIIFFWNERNLMKGGSSWYHSKNIAMRQQIEPNLFQFSLIHNGWANWLFSDICLQRLRESCPAFRIFIHLSISMESVFLSWLGVFIAIPSKYWFLLEMLSLLWGSITFQELTFQTLCLKP